jgi:hypothetical protein
MALRSKSKELKKEQGALRDLLARQFDLIRCFGGCALRSMLDSSLNCLWTQH